MAATPSAPAAIRWIDDADSLSAALEGWHGEPVVGIDTEFVRERTYWPKLALVQLSVPDRILLVDPLQPGVTDALAPLFGDRNVLKLMHSASEDLQACRTGCGFLPQPLFDTQLAAAFAGVGSGLGYRNLVEAITGVQLEKGETRSDWLKRPLGDRQLEYAADDVRHLHALHAELSKKLAATGREEWLLADCQRAVDAAAEDRPEPWPHLQLRGAQMLDADGQARLCRLLRWRDREARNADRPRGWILDNELAIALARRPPDRRESFDRMLDGRPRTPRQLREPLWQQLRAPLDTADRDVPLAAGPDEGERRRVRRMQSQVADIAAELDIPDTLLVSRRHLEMYVSTGQWPEALTGWREPLLRPVLEPDR